MDRIARNDHTGEARSAKRIAGTTTIPHYPNMAHIKVLHGSGDLIYRNLEADGLTVAITLIGSAVIYMAGGITIDSDGKACRTSSDKLPHSRQQRRRDALQV